MELIIKPTGRCNFNCSFCSANLLNIKHSINVSDKLKETIDILKPDNIIFTGGDPLMVSPSYYDEILSLGNHTISFTTNLKDFYLNPLKWLELFKNNRVGIGTSFQYGNERKWDKNTVYTEEYFPLGVIKRKLSIVGEYVSSLKIISLSILIGYPCFLFSSHIFNTYSIYSLFVILYISFENSEG